MWSSKKAMFAVLKIQSIFIDRKYYRFTNSAFWYYGNSNIAYDVEIWGAGHVEVIKQLQLKYQYC